MKRIFLRARYSLVLFAVLLAACSKGIPEGPYIGFFDQAQGVLFLRKDYSAGEATVTIAGDKNRRAILGRWAPGVILGVGSYDPATGAFALKDMSRPDAPEERFIFGPSGQDLWPLAGDWSGGGVQTVGVYDQRTSTFHLRAANSGDTDKAFVFGPAGKKFIPIAGDWDGDGIQSVGLFDPADSVFFLKNANAAGPADIVFQFGPAGSGSIPFVTKGANKVNVVGIYQADKALYWIASENKAGASGRSFQFGAPGVAGMPVFMTR